MDSPALADAIAGRGNTDTALLAASEDLAADRHRLDELAGLFAAGAVTSREWMTARDPIHARIRNAERQLATVTDTGALTGLVGNAEHLREQWTLLGLDRRQAIIRAVLDHAVITPGTPGARELDISRVQPTWRL